jgi:hypothetical protein
MSNFRLVERNYHDEKSHTNTSQPTSSPEHIQILSSCLKGSAEKIDYGSDDNSHSSSQSVSSLLAFSKLDHLDFGENCLLVLPSQLHRKHHQ